MNDRLMYTTTRRTHTRMPIFRIVLVLVPPVDTARPELTIVFYRKIYRAVRSTTPDLLVNDFRVPQYRFTRRVARSRVLTFACHANTAAVRVIIDLSH